MNSLRDPSAIYYQNDGLRRSIIIAYWVVILLALPLWWSTTSIQRLSLPSSRVQEQSQRRLQLPIAICIESNNSRFIDDVKSAMDRSSLRDPSRWRGILVKVLGQPSCGMSFPNYWYLSDFPSASGSNLYRVISHEGPPTIHQRQLYFHLDGANGNIQMTHPVLHLTRYSSRCPTCRHTNVPSRTILLVIRYS